MKLLTEVPKEFEVSISRDELLSILAVSGHVAGGSRLRYTIEQLGKDVVQILHWVKPQSPWNAAADELGAYMSGSINAAKKGFPDG